MNSGNSITKILILSANPKGTKVLRLEEERREIEEGLQLARHRDNFSIKSVGATRYRDIHRAILNFEPHIVHFSGHGAGEDGLVFEDEIGQEKLVDAEALAGLFENFASHVKCVVLNACYSEIQAKAIAQNIDYVIGMSQEIGDKAAIEFAVGFYDALGYGKPFPEAYKLGRSVIRMAGIRENLIPQILTKEQLLTTKANTSMTSASCTQAIEIFLSYSPKDEDLLKKLEMSLSSLEGVRIWHEGKIGAGKNRKVEIDKHLNSARIFLLLISPNFIASDNYRNQVKQAMERQKNGKALVIPVLLSPYANWKRVKFGEYTLGELQHLPRNGKFVTGSGWKNRNEAFVTIAEEFAEELDRLAAELF